MKTLIAICTLILCQEAAAQMYKCADKAGKITYSSAKCSDIGLRDAGEIRDRLQVTPAPQVSPPPAPVAPPARPAPPVSGPVVQPESPKPAAAVEPEKEKRCFVVTGAGGKKFTRCNDKPDEPAE